MTQIGTVTAVPEPGTAVVQVVRQSACAHNCAECAGCGAMAGSLSVRARTALEGPAVLFLAGYLLPAGLPEGLRYACGGLGFALGLLGAVVCDRRLRRRGGAVRYQVIRKL